MAVRSATLPLAGLRIGISGAVPEPKDWGEVHDLDRLILSFVAQLAGLILDYGGEVVHGSQPSFTMVCAEQAREHAATQPKRLSLYASQLWGDPPEVTLRAALKAQSTVVLTPAIGEGGEKNTSTRNDSLTALRLTLVRGMDVLIAVGGKLHAGTGFNPGVLEELTYARWRRIPCFIVAGLGGLSGNLDIEVIQAFSEGNLLDQRESSHLLSTAADLASYSDIFDQYVGELLFHIGRSRDRFLNTQKDSIPIKFRSHHSSLKQIATYIADVDLESVKLFSERFADLRGAMAQKNVSEVKKILNSPPY